ncbi:unnamed protein product [Agarophyton chilense]
MPKRRHTPRGGDPTFVCATCDAPVLERNRVLHNVFCQRNVKQARHAAGARKPDTAYAHSIYSQYAQSQIAYTPTAPDRAGKQSPIHQMEHHRDRDGVYRNVAYVSKLASERAAVQTPSEAPSSPALSLAPFPLSPSMQAAAAYDMPRQVLPASRSRQVASRYSEAYRDCQYCGKECTREHHMTHELQCAFTPIQCARCAQYLRRVDEQYHLQSGCLHGVMNGSTRSIVTTSRAIARQGREIYTSDFRKMAGAAAFALAAYVGSRLVSRGGRGGDGPHIRYETVDANGAHNEP